MTVRTIGFIGKLVSLPVRKGAQLTWYQAKVLLLSALWLDFFALIEELIRERVTQ
jgi:hypothetical protein